MQSWGTLRQCMEQGKQACGTAAECEKDCLNSKGCAKDYRDMLQDIRRNRSDCLNCQRIAKDSPTCRSELLCFKATSHK